MDRVVSSGAGRAAARFVTVSWLGFASVALPGGATAVDLEQLVSPGPLVEGHADVESDCRRCHQPFQRESEGALCLVCHEAVDADLRDQRGFHGLQSDTTARDCRGCHGDHRGRDADIVGLDAETFDHRRTDHPLAGAHLAAPCAGCHPSGKKWRDAPADCFACHARDDVHQGRLGEDCTRCHDERSWREVRFDHARTDFALSGRHVDVDCVLCHPSREFRRTALECSACHAVDDVHRGLFGNRCGDCHDATGWRQASFDHERKTRFPLRGRHREATCDSCHGASIGGVARADTKRPGGGAAKLDTRCVACHRMDDEHRGDYGEDCAACHVAAGWARVRFDHDRRTKFPLRGAHVELDCERCHRGRVHEERLARDCHGCHAADDVHRGQEGRRCETCHDSTLWAGRVRFDHDLARFPLLGLHAAVPCEECHESMAFQDTEESCRACHAKDDTHGRRLGPDCERCHNPNGWRLWRFDHDRGTDFPLRGAHAALDCLGCHTSPAPGGAGRESRCESCHARDDVHRGSFGERCADCHDDTGWKSIRLRDRSRARGASLGNTAGGSDE